MAPAISWILLVPLGLGLSALDRAPEVSEKMFGHFTLLYNCKPAVTGKVFEVPRTVMFYWSLIACGGVITVEENPTVLFPGV